MSIRSALLGLLSERPKYGLQLQQEFESRTGKVWPLNVGQVYTTLQRLERDGLVASKGVVEGKQRDFHITSAGQAELRAWIEEPSDLSTPPRDELVIKVLIGLSLLGIDMRRPLQLHRRHLVERMQHYTQVKAAAADDELALLLVADFELFRLDGTVRWLDSVDARVTRVATPARKGNT